MESAGEDRASALSPAASRAGPLRSGARSGSQLRHAGFGEAMQSLARGD